MKAKNESGSIIIIAVAIVAAVVAVGAVSIGGYTYLQSRKATQPAPVAAGPTNEISEVTLICRAVSLVNVNASANNTIVFSFIDELKNSPLTFVDAKDAKEPGTRFDGELGAEEPPGTFTFKVIWKLRNPLKL